MSFSNLIAVNCHPFHDPADVRACLLSVAEAVRLFAQQSKDRIETRVYWHNSAPMPADLADLVAANGFIPVEAPHRSNGVNLNAQIEAAVQDGFNAFYRVDGDDTVAPERFAAQADALRTNRCDICGAGLRYAPMDGPDYVMMPAEVPGPRDFVENQFVLHPSMAFNLRAVSAAKLRYWGNRLEDKQFLLQARKAGLRIINLQIVAGSYVLHRGTRNRLAQKWLSFRLNVAHLLQTRALHYIPYVCALFAAQVLLGSNRMRRIRYVLRRPTRPHKRPATVASPTEARAEKAVTT